MARKPRESASVDHLTARLIDVANKGVEVANRISQDIRKMTATIQDALAAAAAEKVSLDANTASINKLVAQGPASGSGADAQPVVDAINANKAVADSNQALLDSLLTSPAPGAISVSPTSISGSVGTPFTTQLGGVGGVGPYTFATADAFSNTGATLNADGTVNAATVAGTDTVNVTATDSTGATGTTPVTVTAA